MTYKRKLKTRFFDIDRILNHDNGGGKLIMLASRPGMGKTTLLQDIMLNMAELNEGTILYFSSEMSENKILERFKCKRDNNYKLLADIVIDNNCRDIYDIEHKIEQYENLTAVFIDCGELTKNSCGYKRKKVLSELKNISRKNNVNIIYTYCLRRPPNHREIQKPLIYDCDCISRDTVDAIIVLYRAPYYESKDSYAEISFLKTPIGELSETLVNFDFERHSFYCDYNKKPDTARQTRAELHLHTKLSDDISVIGTYEIISKAKEKGLSAIAFTNLNNVQDFPKIARESKDTDVKIIYGIEVSCECENELLGKNLTLLVKNQEGIKELYKVISSMYSYGSCDYIDLSVLKENRKNLLVGAGKCDTEILFSKSNAEIEKLGDFYDYFEIYPAINDEEKEINKRIVALGEKLGNRVVAVSDAHYLTQKDSVCREIVQFARGCEPDGRDNLYLRTTQEMLNEFSYLGEKKTKEVVINNPNCIADSIEFVEPIKENICIMRYEEDAASEIKEICLNKAYEIYGIPLPKTVEERLHNELFEIENGDFATEFLIAYKIAKNVTDNGYFLGCRGTVGSSFVSFLLGISNINPLPPHYYCPQCNHFEESDLASDGFDLPTKKCPYCISALKTDGHNIPYEGFMGLDGDVDLSFGFNIPSEMYLPTIQYLGDNFGESKIALAGTVSVLWDDVAESHLKKYKYKTGRTFSIQEEERIIENLTGVKKNDSVHPAGIVLVPKDFEFEDVTPLKTNWAPISATHFDFNDLDNTLLKTNILSYKSIDFLDMLQKNTGVKVDQEFLKNPELLRMFKNADTLGISEFQSEFMREILIKTEPKSFSDLVKACGFAHGTNVWKNNGEDLINQGVLISDMPTVREDIMNDLINIGADKRLAYNYMKAVRMGLVNSGMWDKDKESTFKEFVKGLGLWYFDYCGKIHYMFPKAHAIEFVIIALYQAWFKKYCPEQFYKTYISCYLKDEEGLTEAEMEQYNAVINECKERGIEISN